MIVTLQTARVAALWSPYSNGLWGRHVLNLQHAQWCLDHGVVVSPEVPEPREADDSAFLYHAAKIAWLANAPRLDPIWIVGASDVWPIRDGNHRLGAAILRGDETIAANYEGGADLLGILDGSADAPWKAGDLFDIESMWASAWWDEFRKGCRREHEIRGCLWPSGGEG